ncbi:hypothetical protein ACLVWU_12725 [Bdellovibrio sp. HCB290]|uniref:hypothetical protein n=1 Tax=Bdellovibrio sp. HCB290 TaxID=3394356 RepID=UPI0039B647D9
MEQSKIANATESNWHSIKSAVHRRWDEISDEELESLEQSAEKVIDLLADRYHISPKDAEERLHAAVLEEENRSHAISEVQAAEMRFESDGGRVVPSFQDFHEAHDIYRARVYPENPH